MFLVADDMDADMEHVKTADVSNWMGPATEKRSLSEALGAEEVAVNYYELAPGESFAFGYHRHADQEELFYLLEGTATFETENGEIAVGTGEAIYFAPGEFQRGWNRGDGQLRALAIGAPAGMGDTTILRECPDCGDQTEQSIQPTEEKDALLTLCVECATETGRFD